MIISKYYLATYFLVNFVWLCLSEMKRKKWHLDLLMSLEFTPKNLVKADTFFLRIYLSAYEVLRGENAEM